MHYIVGSGPSGIAVASALLEQGLHVTMLDMGQECDPARLRVVDQLAYQSPENWDPRLLSQIQGSALGSAVPQKLCYGSNFPYGDDLHSPVDQDGTRCLYSFARGGLSNVWGASVLPARVEDFSDWPIDAESMAPHYTAVAKLLNIAGEHDELETTFPFHAPPAPPLNLSRQARTLLGRMQARHEHLARAGILYGRSRLAVRTVADEHGRGCQHVGLCLTGCPYRAIWNAASHLPGLLKHESFRYYSGVKVTNVESTGPGRVRIHGISADKSTPYWDGETVFLACGPLPTARIILSSLNVLDVPLRLQYQPYFLLPMLGFDNVPEVANERMHTLAQLYLELHGEASRPAHLQIYTFNNFMAARLAAWRRWLGPAAAWVRRRVEGRLLVLQGYLDSTATEIIQLVARREGMDDRVHLHLRGSCAPTLRRDILKIVKRLARHARDVGAIPLRPMLQIGRPGEGNHIGGIFPMRHTPTSLESDTLGQLPGIPNVHIVDASVLPNLPSSTYTYTIMANAHRIASEVAIRYRH